MQDALARTQHPETAPARPALRPADAARLSDAALLAQVRRRPDGWARAELVERYLPLVRALARRYASSGEQQDDLVQIGSVGLLKAIDRFDPERGTELKTYAVPMIVGEMKRHFRDYTWPVRVRRSVQELNLKLVRLVDELSRELGRSPTVPELARRAEATEEEVVEALEAGNARRPRSLSTPETDDDGDFPALGDMLGDVDPGYELSEARTALREGIEALDERERTILRLRFFEGLTQSEIATHVGCSQMHVSRLLRGIFDKLGERVSLEEPA